MINGNNGRAAGEYNTNIDPAREKGTRFKKTTIAVFCLMLAAVIFLAAAIICLNNNQNAYLNMSERAQELLLTSINDQREEIDTQKSRIRELESALSSVKKATGGEDIEDLLLKIEEQKSLLAERQEELEEMQSMLQSIVRETNGYTVYFKKYVVVKGDTLRSICRKNGLSYLSNRKVILGINGISNENMITVRQTILLPAVLAPKE